VILNLFGGLGLRNSRLCNELKNDFVGRLELDFEGIHCEFGGSARLLPLLLNRVTTFFSNLIYWDYYLKWE